MPPADATGLPVPTREPGAVADAPHGGALVRSGAELVELSERFFRGVFVGCVLFVGFSSLAALVLLPLRDSDAGYDTATVPLVAVLLLLTPVAVLRARELNQLLRRRPAAQAVLVAVAAALVAYPLRSELWWPSCALIMLLATVVSVRVALCAALAVLLVNLAAHIIAGDLGETPAVSVIGLWVGFGFWSAAFALIPDRLSAYVLRLNTRMAGTMAAARPPRRVRAFAGPTADDAPVPAAAPKPPPDDVGALRTLTARQLQVIALLADGCRYDEIAACLSISERQVQRHVSRAVTRFGVRNATELVARAVAVGLVPAARQAT